MGELSNADETDARTEAGQKTYRVKKLLSHFRKDGKFYMNVNFEGYTGTEGVLLQDILDVKMLKRYIKREQFRKRPKSIPTEITDHIMREEQSPNSIC